MRSLVLLPIMAQAVVSSLQGPSAVQVEEQSPGLHRRGAYTRYVAWASDPKNQTQLQETRKFLNETVLNDASPITIFQPLSGNSFLWGGITLDDAALKKVQAYPAIKAVKLSPDFKDFLAVPLVEKRQGIFDILKNLRRPLNWKRQSPASKNLALISQPKDTMELFYPDFVYDAKAGEGAWIYVVDNGVKFDVQSDPGQREFPSDKVFPLPNGGANNPRDDDHPYSHGTSMASLAMGRRFGVAKSATLISVKTQRDPVDSLEGLKNIALDIDKNPDRAKKTVVLIATGIDYNPNDPDDQTWADQYKEAYQPLLDRGVPVVVASGNERRSSDEVSTLPAYLFDSSFPVIVVGGTDKNGNRVANSQGGDKLAVHAPGDAVEYVDKTGAKMANTGTSVASAEVAGLIATYMGYPIVPWTEPSGDTKDDKLERVRRIRAYLQSDDSSVVRSETDKNVRVIWNGATEEDHERTQSNNAPQQPYQPGTCKVNLTQVQETYSAAYSTYGWDGKIIDDAGEDIKDCDPAYEVVPTTTDYAIDCQLLKNKVNVHVVGGDSLEFKIGDQDWKTEDSNCKVETWGMDPATGQAKRSMECGFKC